MRLSKVDKHKEHKVGDYVYDKLHVQGELTIHTFINPYNAASFRRTLTKAMSNIKDNQGIEGNIE